MRHTPLELWEMIQIEYRTYQGYDREDDDDTTYHLINNKDAIGIKFSSHLVYQPSKSEPPKQGTKDNTKIPYPHLQWHVRHNKGKLGKGSHKQEHDKRITERYQKRRDAIVPKRALLVAALMHILGRIALEAIDTKHKEQDATKYLQVKLILRIIHKVHHETHAKTCKKRIDYIAAGSTNACNETIPSPLIQSALDTQYANWSHRGRGNHTYDNSLEYEIKDIYLYWKC